MHDQHQQGPHAEEESGFHAQHDMSGVAMDEHENMDHGAHDGGGHDGHGGGGDGQQSHHAHMVADFRRRFWVVLVRSDPRDVVAIPLAAGILFPVGFFLPPAIGAFLMSLSTVLVAVNARRLESVGRQLGGSRTEAASVSA